MNWSQTQQRLTAAGWPVGAIDGDPGKMTYAALFAYVARHRVDAICLSIGVQARTTLPAYDMVKPNRLADFLAQTCHETGGYLRFTESMRYSAKRLCAVWPGRFPTLASALPYAWDPSDPDQEDQALANKVYGGRMGNELDGTADDDGWDHRGGGMLQHTGAGEYELLRQRLGFDHDDLLNPANALVAACDYWGRRKVNTYCDRADWKGSRRAVNGGTIGLAEIGHLRDRALRVLA